MRRRKLTAVLTTTLLAGISAFAAPSASAVVFTLTPTGCTGGTNVAICYESAGKEKLELTGEQSETVEESLLEEGGKEVFDKIVLTVLTTPLQVIECTESEGSGTIFQKEPLVEGKKTTLKGFLKYKGCELTTEPKKKCKVNAMNETKELTGTLENEKELKLVPTSSTVFIEITYSNNPPETCPAAFAGTHAVTGSQTVELLEPGLAQGNKKGKAIGETLEFFSAKAELSQQLTMSFTGLGDNVYISKVA